MTTFYYILYVPPNITIHIIRLFNRYESIPLRKETSPYFTMSGEMTGKRDAMESGAPTPPNEPVKKIPKIPRVHFERCDLDPENCDLVIVGDYTDDFTGVHDLHPLAVSADKPTVRVYACGSVAKSKYWEPQGTQEYNVAVAVGTWLPQIVADELQARLLAEGEDCIPRGEFMEEVCNDGGESVLIVDAELLRNGRSAFRAMHRCKRFIAKYIIVAFMRKYLPTKSTMAIAKRFVLDGPTIEEARGGDFAALSDRLRVATVDNATGEILLRVIQLANTGRSHPLITGTVNVKIFLAAYMIAIFPTHVFEEMGVLETAVYDDTLMLVSWHKAIDALARGVPWSLVLLETAPELPRFLCRYLRSFKVLHPNLGTTYRY
jgi:hypothetical protein